MLICPTPSADAGGLYHALIHLADLPYLPFDRPPDYDVDRHDGGGNDGGGGHNGFVGLDAMVQVTCLMG